MVCYSFVSTYSRSGWWPTCWLSLTLSGVPLPNRAAAIQRGLSLAISLLAALAASPTVRAQGAPVSDDFHSTSLNTNLWTFVNPLGDSTLTMNGTNAVISVPGGTTHDLWANDTSAPRLMQTIGNVDFQVEAKFDSGLAFQAHGSQEVGIMVQQDIQGFIRFALFSLNTSSYAYVATFA